MQDRIVDGRYYTIQLSRFVALCEATGLTDEIISALALDHDWHKGAEHQRWLDSAPISEIAEWVKGLEADQEAQ